MLRKKMQELTIGESLIVSAGITIVCYLPFLAWILYEYVQARRIERRNV